MEDKGNSEQLNKVEIFNNNNLENVAHKNNTNYARRGRGRGGARERVSASYGGSGNHAHREAEHSDHPEGPKRSRGGNKYPDHHKQEDGVSTESNFWFRPKGADEKFFEKVQQISGPTYDLPPVDISEKKFNSRNRFYIANVGDEISNKDLEDLFKPYGETSEIFVNKEKNFAFIKMDYHCNAEKARKELDGTILKSRNLKIRFAPNTATVKIKNLTPFVSNELLYYAFSVFGEIERAMVCVDERGRPTGEAIIDFCRKSAAMFAIRKCSENCFFLTSSLRPCIVEPFDYVDNNDGYFDKSIPRKNMDYQKERERGPRLAVAGSFEDEFGIRWKQLYALYTQKEDALKKELELEKEKLEAQMEYARYEHETEVLRTQLRVREMNKEKQKREWELKQRQVEQERLCSEEMMRRNQEEIESRMHRQEDVKRKQDEDNLFVQAHNLDSLLTMQEKAFNLPEASYNNYNKQSECTQTRMFASPYSRQTDVTRYPAENGGVWVTDNTRQKRRRY